MTMHAEPGSRPADRPAGGKDVDMSPDAIERRLATVGALFRLMRSLMTAVPTPRR